MGVAPGSPGTPAAVRDAAPRVRTRRSIREDSNVTRIRRQCAWAAWILAVWWSLLNAAPALAGLAPSQVSGVTAIESVRGADLLVVQRALEHRIVAQKLRDYGVAPEDVSARLANMSDEDLHTLASATKGLPSGGDGLGALISILIIVLLVILILKLLNKEIVVR